MNYIQTFTPFRRRFDRLMTASLGRAIAGTEAEETLREYKKEAQSREKRQADIRRVFAKGGVLNVDEAVHRIQDRRRNEVEQIQCTTQLRGTRGEHRKAYAHQLDFLAELDNSHRSASHLE